jgi:hypothetical protein
MQIAGIDEKDFRTLQPAAFKVLAWFMAQSQEREDAGEKEPDVFPMALVELGAAVGMSSKQIRGALTELVEHRPGKGPFLWTSGGKGRAPCRYRLNYG